MDKRLQLRKGVPKLLVYVSDGTGYFPGVVNNISLSGLVVDSVADEFNHREEKFSLTVHINEQTFRLRAIPRWVNKDHNGKTVGVRIFSAPRDWFKFVDNI